METRPNASRARIAIIFLITIVVFDLLSALSSYLQLNLLQDLRSGIEFSEEELNANDLREQILGIVWLIIYLGCVVSFIMWFRRGYYNLHQKTSYLGYNEGMAAGAWFIPFVNLWRPFQIFKEMVNKTEELYHENNINYTISVSKVLMGIWWAVWISNNIMGNLEFRMGRNADNVDALIEVTSISMIGSFLNIIAAILLIPLIRSYERLSMQLVDVPNENIFLTEQLPQVSIQEPPKEE